MPYTGKFQVFEDIIKEIMIVYKHDSRPWLIGYSGGKDSTLLVSLVYEAMKRLKDAGAKLDKTVHVITSDTMVENPIVKNYMHSSSDNINRAAGSSQHQSQCDLPGAGTDILEPGHWPGLSYPRASRIQMVYRQAENHADE